jgi:hypothetical protein
MLKLKPVAIAAISAAAATAVLAVSASGSTPATQADVAHQYHAGAPGFKYLDLAKPKGPSTGDEFIDYATVLSPSSGRRVGLFAQTCTATQIAGRLFGVCEGVLKLPGGDLTFAADDNNNQVSSSAITGGTGTYSRASGTLVTDARSRTITLTTHVH